MKRSQIKQRVQKTVHVFPHYTAVNSLTSGQVLKSVSQQVDQTGQLIITAVVSQLLQDLEESNAD